MGMMGRDGVFQSKHGEYLEKFPLGASGMFAKLWMKGCDQF
jgi:hypothetical protein